MRTATSTLLALAAILLLPGPASAATCADYSNQAAAQRAADTRDADHDGIYCESLPCPCSTGGTTTAPPPAPARKTCSGRTTRGVIAGAVRCLRAGEFCTRSRNAAYRRYRFRCATASDGRARLRRTSG
ncbi:MAG TPA: hypothetical protein VGF63_06970 [Solirubrobacteraceae bacterium]|jgi:hypothetical protein